MSLVEILRRVPIKCLSVGFRSGKGFLAIFVLRAFGGQKAEMRLFGIQEVLRGREHGQPKEKLTKVQAEAGPKLSSSKKGHC